jgi:mono/diheme cytochrome c family protein
MRMNLLLVALLLASTAASAHPLAQGDAVKGRALVEQHCISCHASSFGGDGSGIYTRPDHIVKNGK